MECRGENLRTRGVVIAAARGRPVGRGRRRGWQAAFLAALVWSCLAPESGLAAAAAAAEAAEAENAPAQQQTAAGWGAAGGWAPVRKEDAGAWRGRSDGSFAEAASGDIEGADPGLLDREFGRGREADPAEATAAASPAAAAPGRRGGKIRSAGVSASPDGERRSRTRRAAAKGADGGGGMNGEPLPGGTHGLVLPGASRGEGRGQVQGRQRRAQSEGERSSADGAGGGEGGVEEDGEQPGEQEEGETTLAEDGLYGEEEEDGVGSVGLLALAICFGLLFCVMEVAKCYFLLECRRRRRWRRWRRRRAQENTREMPIASSRVIATDEPFAGSKDGWVEIVIDGVSMRNALPEEKDMPSAPGYAVAGAAHALQEAIEHARRLTPNRSYSATLFPPVAATPEQPGAVSLEIRPPEIPSTDESSEMVPASLDSPRTAARAHSVSTSSPTRP